MRSGYRFQKEAIRKLPDRDYSADRHAIILEEVNLDDANACGLRLAPHLRGVLPGREGRHNRCFHRISRLQTSSFQLRLLIALPVVVLPHDRSVLVS